MLTQQTLLIDGHIHIYPHYNLKSAINQGVSNLITAAQKDHKLIAAEKFVPIWFLTERFDCNFYNQALHFSDELNLKEVKVIPSKEKESLIVEKDGKPILHILAGRQIVTKENLEILSLISTLYLKDREKSIDEVIDRVIDSGGIPAINWAPGKWFFSRGKVVERTIENHSPDNLVIGDTSLRTRLWRLPRLMAEAQKRGFKIIAGSDPFPLKNEESQIGHYGFALTGKFDDTRPAASLRNLLKDRQTTVTFIGKRNPLLTCIKREFMIMREKKSVL